jgi:hypothetical protein
MAAECTCQLSATCCHFGGVSKRHTSVGHGEGRTTEVSGAIEGDILYNFVQFGGHASRTPCAAMNFGLGHGSRHPVPNVNCVTLGSNLPWRCKKGRIFENFRLECRIFGGVTPKFVGCRSAELANWVTGHNPCRIERNCTVYRKSNRG